MSNDPIDPAGGNPYASGTPMPAAPASTPAPVQAQLAYDQTGDSTGGLIPYKNPHALIAYYLGIASMLCFIGIPFGIASIILGVKGLKARARNPIIKGSVHAWIGIVVGIISLAVHLAVIAMIVIGATAGAR